MDNDSDNIRKLSLRINERLAKEVDRMSEMNGRSFNSEAIELIKKGIELMESERRFLKHVEPVHIVRSASKIDEDDSPKHRDAPDAESGSDKKREARELA